LAALLPALLAVLLAVLLSVLLAVLLAVLPVQSLARPAARQARRADASPANGHTSQAFACVTRLHLASHASRDTERVCFIVCLIVCRSGLTATKHTARNQVGSCVRSACHLRSWLSAAGNNRCPLCVIHRGEQVDPGC
jgi:hypothetical protein